VRKPSSKLPREPSPIRRVFNGTEIPAFGVEADIRLLSPIISQDSKQSELKRFLSESRSQFRVGSVVLHNGERLPLLLSDQGVPDWYATLFITTQS
jgi:hypothetical protein